MKSMKKLLLLFKLVGATTAFVSCEEEEPTDLGGGATGDVCLEELEILSDILYEKSITFSNNATPSTCEAVRTAALNLINAAENCGYGYLYTDQTQFWLDYDCSIFE